ncbi:Transcriptional regulatory protein TdiR [Rosistilla carotiformis]|uniref:Transcriptional regulatory protein TdiR n=1 Tax=Rosistilla carotiformis TaxID=2528017 RepID=A0A518K0C4_9BACT|nr:response regulator [Rosistilla carotiformis]QDV71240.1 Transcriptional regulatory protein TdiR [Rosistilla carotiformis]
MSDGLTFYLISNFDPRVRAVVKSAADNHNDSAVRELSLAVVLQKQAARSPGCVIIDIDQTEGLDTIHEYIHENARTSKIILLSEQADLEFARRAFRMGVFDCLSKPLDTRQLLEAVQRAIDSLRSDQKTRQIDSSDAAALETLTPRELEYFSKLLEGWSIKTLSIHFRVSIQTAAKHRARVLSKLKAENEVELVLRFDKHRSFLSDGSESGG